MSFNSGSNRGVGGVKARFGRKRPVALGLRLKLGNYLRAALPPIPPAADYSLAGQPALSNPYLNDQLRDCVIAGGYHIVATETGNAGHLFSATQDQLIADYGAIGGYNPTDPSTDQGCEEPTALNYWVANGFANGTKPLGWIAVDAGNAAEMKAALYLFENLYLGAELPDAWVNPFPDDDGFTWDVAGSPIQENGHCIAAIGYGDGGLKIDTWGCLGTLTWDALAKYFVPSVYGAVYAILTPDELTKGQAKAPNGVDWTALITDFDSMGGTVPLPERAPAPPMAAIGPGSAVTLVHAQGLVSSAFRESHRLLTQQQAIDLAKAALAAGWPRAKS